MQELSVGTPHGTVAVIDYGGSGRAVVLLHGANRNPFDWVLVMPDLRDLRLVAVEFRWHGRSSDEGDVGLDANADDAEAVIETLGLDDPLVVGHSLGGLVAVVYGARHSKCRGVLNLDGYGPGLRREFEGVSDEQYHHYAAVLDGMMRATEASAPASGDDAWREYLLAEWSAFAASSGWEFPAEAVTAANERSFRKGAGGLWYRRPEPAYRRRLAAAIQSLDLFDIYRAIEAPLLVYLCTRVPPMPDAVSNEVLHARFRFFRRELEELALRRPNLRVRIVDASHSVMWDEPELVARDISAMAHVEPWS